MGYVCTVLSLIGGADFNASDYASESKLRDLLWSRHAIGRVDNPAGVLVGCEERDLPPDEDGEIQVERDTPKMV